MKHFLLACWLALLMVPIESAATISDANFPHVVEVRTLANGQTWLLLKDNYPDWVERTDVQVEGREVTATLHYHRGVYIMQMVPSVWVRLGYVDPGSYVLTVRKVPADPPPYAGPSGEVSRTFEVVNSSGPTATQIPYASAVTVGLLILLLGLTASIALLPGKR